MNVLKINGNYITSLNMLHKCIENNLQINHYGQNFDAMWDVLSTKKNIHIQLYNVDQLKKHLGSDYDTFLSLLEDLHALEQRHITFERIN